MFLKTSELVRKFSSVSNKTFFVTTPIYYVNANPHIGHLYSSVISDAICRWQAIRNVGAKFELSTGTDEHGSKIQRAAVANATSPLEFCNQISAKYKQLADCFSINYTDFIRTTDEDHKVAVHKFWGELKSNGFIYSTNYKGWYCVSDETFLTQSQLQEKTDGEGKKILVSAESGHPVEWTEELNYMFPLSSFQNDLLYWLKKNENTVRPKKFQKIVLDALNDEPLPNISISRPSSRVHWSIQVPEDETQTIYVWLDALVNYLTAAGYSSPQNAANFQQTWPADIQVVGKDILKFHAIYWPAFLMAVKLEPPRSILCHSHWTVDGEKMSKSKNNVVCPFNRSEIYTADGLRYFLLREGVAHSDGNYSDTKVIRILNSELADTFGNLLSRCCATSLNPAQAFPAAERSAFESVGALDVTKKLIESVNALPGLCEGHYTDLNFYKAVDEIVATLHRANLFFETLKPWELKKQPNKFQELSAVLHITLETLRVAAVLLQPIIPNLADNLLNKISVPQDQRCFRSLSQLSWLDPDFRARSLSPQTAVIYKRIMPESKHSKQANK